MKGDMVLFENKQTYFRNNAYFLSFLENQL